MADKSSRLSEILKQEYQSRGVVGGLTSAAGKRIREKMDIRNSLFGGSGVGALIGRKIFGKGYSAIGDRSQNDLSAKTAPLLAEQSGKLDIISVNSQITAKNSMALPSMARDMNLMKLNIFKLVKLQGGTANTNKTDMFWQKSKLREAEYEQQFKKGSSPSKIDSKSSLKPEASPTGIMGLFAGTIGSIVETIWNFKGTIAAAGLAFVALGGSLSKVMDWLSTTSVGKSLGLKGSSDFDAGRGSGWDNTTGERSWKNPMDVNWGNVGNKSMDVASNAGGAALGGVGLYAGSKIPKTTFVKSGKDLMDGRDLTKIKNGLAVDRLTTQEVVGKGRLGKVVQGLLDFSLEAKNKGWVARIAPKFVKRGLEHIAQKAALLIASLIGGGITGGLSWAITLISAAWLAKDVYDIYDAIMGPGGIRDELTEEDKGSKSPTPANNKNATPINPSIVVGGSGISLEQIGQAESGKMGYDAANNGKAGDMPNGMPGLSSKTVGEVMKLQNEHKLVAAGKYQLIPNTLRGLVNQGVVSTNEKFDQATQDRLGKALYDEAMTAAGNDVVKQQYELSKRWAVVSNPYTGQSNYAGIGNNKASIMGNTASGGTALAANSQSLESLVRDAMMKNGAATINNVTNNTSTGGGGGTQMAQAEVMDVEVGKLLTRMWQ